MSVAAVNARCSDISAPWSQVRVAHRAAGEGDEGDDETVADGVAAAVEAEVAQDDVAG